MPEINNGISLYKMTSMEVIPRESVKNRNKKNPREITFTSGIEIKTRRRYLNLLFTKIIKS